MEEKGYFSFFILLAILSQGILAKFLKDNCGESSQLLVRPKRVIDRRPGGEITLSNGDLPYIVSLKYYYHMHCIATILSPRTVITAARCVPSNELTVYTVHSGSVYSYRGNEHNVIEKKMHGHNPSRTRSFSTGIALLIVNPPFVYSHTTGKIGLHSGPVLTGMEGDVAGWGYRIGAGPVESSYIKKLRFISVPIMNHRECLNIYRGHFPITDEDVCTYHPQRLCGNWDIGAPLVIDEQIVGVHIGEIDTMHDIPIKPDVFVLLQHLNYGSWIRNNIV